MRKLNKREQAILNYLNHNALVKNEQYMAIEFSGNPQEHWYLAHAAEAIKVRDEVRKLLTGE